MNESSACIYSYYSIYDMRYYPVRKITLANYDNLSKSKIWIKEYRQNGFKKCFFDARQFIEKSSYDLQKDVKSKRVTRRKTSISQEPVWNKFFQHNYLIFLHQHFENLGSLYDLRKFKNFPSGFVSKTVEIYIRSCKSVRVVTSNLMKYRKNYKQLSQIHPTSWTMWNSCFHT